MSSTQERVVEILNKIIFFLPVVYKSLHHDIKQVMYTKEIMLIYVYENCHSDLKLSVKLFNAC